MTNETEDPDFYCMYEWEEKLDDSCSCTGSPVSSDYEDDKSELDRLKKYIILKHLSENTKKIYLRHYNVLRKALRKDITLCSDALIMNTCSNLSKTNNTKAAYLNVCIIIKKIFKQDMSKLDKHRNELKKKITVETKANNSALATTLPSLEEFDDHIEWCYNNKKYKEFIINYLIRYSYVRNLDLVFDIVYRQKDMVDLDKNYIWLGRGGKCTYIRRDYKTVGTYGEKKNIIIDKKLVTALKALTGPLIENPKNVGYYVKSLTFNELGESKLLKIIIEFYRKACDFNKLQEISTSRGTSIETLIASYNIQC